MNTPRMERRQPLPPETTVLAVDDDPDDLQDLVELLESFGITTLRAKTGAEGLEMARSRQPDVIICDLNMPGISGQEFCRELKRDPTTASIPTVSCSGLPDHLFRDFESGATGHLEKPVLPARLEEELRNALDRGQAGGTPGVSGAKGLAARLREAIGHPKNH